MKKFKIYAGLGGGFGGAEYLYSIDLNSLDEAENLAYCEACDIYESYVGNHGLRTIDEIMEEDNCDIETAEEIYIEEKESWLEYSVEEDK